jgi:hypothetical protein
MFLDSKSAASLDLAADAEMLRVMPGPHPVRKTLRRQRGVFYKYTRLLLSVKQLCRSDPGKAENPPMIDGDSSPLRRSASASRAERRTAPPLATGRRSEYNTVRQEKTALWYTVTLKDKPREKYLCREGARSETLAPKQAGDSSHG